VAAQALPCPGNMLPDAICCILLLGLCQPASADARLAARLLAVLHAATQLQRGLPEAAEPRLYLVHHSSGLCCCQGQKWLYACKAQADVQTMTNYA
jgi:hypothetical protein